MKATGNKQNLTVRLDRHVIRLARRLAAQRQSSISALVAEQIEALVGNRAAYERAKRQALAYLEAGIPMGKIERVRRDALHDRENLR